ncbi:uncharacterized protein G2W53_029512 [Senna tora]|uniref:Uncharacterized protein n=1 Tax=Senna tora TaxID=362788 RepID=A0A834T397_9FABA|nr:uncharacterized protein G2W53_029512 [Senna tora]
MEQKTFQPWKKHTLLLLSFLKTDLLNFHRFFKSQLFFRYDSIIFSGDPCDFAFSIIVSVHKPISFNPSWLHHWTTRIATSGLF